MKPFAAEVILKYRCHCGLVYEAMVSEVKRDGFCIHCHCGFTITPTKLSNVTVKFGVATITPLSTKKTKRILKNLGYDLATCNKAIQVAISLNPQNEIELTKLAIASIGD